jgi:hypothetical protein
MEFEEQDDEVIGLLSKLKEIEGTYPPEMMASRRQSFVKEIAALGIGAGAAIALKEGAKAAGGSSIPPIASTIVETALIIAIVAEAGFVAVVNRHKVLDLFRTFSAEPTVEQVTAPPDSSLPLIQPAEINVTVEPTMAAATPGAALTPSPDLLFVTGAAEGAEEAGDAGVQANGTPEPNGNNGNHYGQTPIPERTKQSQGSGDPNNNNGNNGNRRNR